MIVTTFAVVIGSYILPGVEVESFMTAIIVAFVLGILNAILKPILVILTIPVTVLTLGLFLLVINAFLIQLTGYLVNDFRVDSFWYALLFSIILSLITWILELPVKPRNTRH
ncbi:MAG: phage holin family protein [Bacteroidales bacterium]|nr:phage holin family protein [Bacteroidales bacterium]